MPNQCPSLAPSQWVVRFAGLVRSGGRVLDVACGTGRHARLFAGLGHPVVGVDRDFTALSGLPQGIESLVADLETAPWPLSDSTRFAAVIVTNYLHRPLLPRLVDVLDDQGVLIYETFATGNETVGRPANPDFLLQSGELLRAVQGPLRIIAFEDGFVTDPKPAFVQRICAVRDDDSPPLARRYFL